MLAETTHAAIDWSKLLVARIPVFLYEIAGISGVDERDGEAEGKTGKLAVGNLDCIETPPLSPPSWIGLEGSPYLRYRKRGSVGWNERRICMYGVSVILDANWQDVIAT